MRSVSGSNAITPGGDVQVENSLAVGFFASICRDRLADDLVDFARDCPEVDLGVHEMTRAALLPALAQGDLALAVLPGAAEPGFHSAELWSDSVMVAMAPDHALATRAALRLADLRDQVFLVSRQPFGADMHRFLAKRLFPLGPPLNATILDMGLPRLLDRVATGEGIALISASHAEHAGEKVEFRPVEAPAAAFPVRAYWREDAPGWPLSALLQRLGAAR